MRGEAAVSREMAGSALVNSASPLITQPTRVYLRDCQDHAVRLLDLAETCRELDSSLMHAVMQTSSPPLLYWQPETVAVMQQVQAWRKGGLPVCFTIDAGPNVHVICEQAAAEIAT